MSCFHPLRAFQRVDGSVVFAERGNIARELELPCGQCQGCRLERSRVWAMRCVHESQMHDFSSFVTLTYDPDNCPISLRYKDFQLFMKRLRKVFPRSRFFMCGEYGEVGLRPHYHALLFGVFFQDRRVWSERDGVRLYRSELLDKLWPVGFSTVGDVTFESAAYTARYCMKKVTGDLAYEHYLRCDPETGESVSVVPEFARMSLKPGIGYSWFAKYRKEVFNDGIDRVVINGVQCRPPRRYREYLDKFDHDLGEAVDFAREQKRGLGLEDRTPERLAVREAVSKARMAFFKRNVE